MQTENKNTDGAGEGLRLIKWANDKYPPIDLSNELPSVMALIKAYKELRRDWDQLKEDNKILRDLCKKMHVELWETISDLRGLNAQGRLNRFGVKRLNDCTDLYEKANNILSPSNTESNGHQSEK